MAISDVVRVGFRVGRFGHVLRGILKGINPWDWPLDYKRCRLIPDAFYVHNRERTMICIEVSHTFGVLSKLERYCELAWALDNGRWDLDLIEVVVRPKVLPIAALISRVHRDGGRRRRTSEILARFPWPFLERTVEHQSAYRVACFGDAFFGTERPA